jgi:hypothetical protein
MLMHTLRPTALVLALLVALPATAAAQNTLFAESGEIGGLPHFLANKGVQKELKLSKTQADRALLALNRVAQAHGNDYLALTALQNKPKERDAKAKEIMKAIADDSMKALAKLITKAQIKRLRELALQVGTINALVHPEVQEKLKLDAKQKDRMKDIYDKFLQGRIDTRKKFNPVTQSQDYQKAWKDLHDDTRKKERAVLTNEQNKTWKEMTGKAFDYKPGLGGYLG